MICIFGNNTIYVEESKLCFIEGNPMSFAILDVLLVMPFEDIFSHEWILSGVWLFSHIMKSAQTLDTNGSLIAELFDSQSFQGSVLF